MFLLKMASNNVNLSAYETKLYAYYVPTHCELRTVKINLTSAYQRGVQSQSETYHCSYNLKYAFLKIINKVELDQRVKQTFNDTENQYKISIMAILEQTYGHKN